MKHTGVLENEGLLSMMKMTKLTMQLSMITGSEEGTVCLVQVTAEGEICAKGYRVRRWSQWVGSS